MGYFLLPDFSLDKMLVIVQDVDEATFGVLCYLATGKVLLS